MSIKETLDDVDIKSIFQRLLEKTVDPHFIPNRSQPWKNSKQVRCHFFIGPRGSGKSTAMEETAEDYYNQGLSIWHLWAARSFENLFWCINQNCRDTYRKYEKMLPKDMVEQIESRPHCNCHRSFPITVISPDYREWDKESLQKFNGTYPYWESFEEFKKAVDLGLVSPELKNGERKLLYEGKLLKPEFLLEKTELIKVVSVPIPKTEETKEQFKKLFFKAALDSRRDGRILTFNPSLCIDEDKFKIIGQMITLAFEYASEHLKELTEEQVGEMRGTGKPVPYAEWTKREKGWHKVCVVINELRSVAPNNKFSPQKGSTDSKRPIVDLTPELRHVNVWFLGDLQSIEDLNKSVQSLANNIIVTGGGLELLGEGYKKYFDMIENLREIEFGRFGFTVKSKHDEKYVPVQVKNLVNSKYPRIDELDKDKAYITWNNSEFLLQKFGFPSFHHRQEGENFWQITGIKSWINERKASKNGEKDGGKESKITGKSKKESTHFLCNYAADLFLAGNGKWDDIPKKVLENKEILQKEHNIPEELILGMSSLNGKSLNNKVRGIKEIATKLDKSKFDANFSKNRKEIDS